MTNYIDYETQKAYKEVNDILNIMGNEYKNKINKNLLKLFKEKEAKDFQSDIVPNISFMKQNISKKAMSILAVLNIKYWIDDLEEKNKIIESYAKNEQIRTEKYKIKFDTSIVSKVPEHQQAFEHSPELLPVKQNIFSKIKQFFIKIFKK